MNSAVQRFNVRYLAITTLLGCALSACDSGNSLQISAPFSNQSVNNQAAAEQTENTTGGGPEASAVTIGSASSIALDSVTVDASGTDNDASGGTVAAAFLADRASLGPVKLMAVGDSITHGVAGVSSYRREFSSLMQAASCGFTMVGSQQTSHNAGGDPDCVDTVPLGDGWGWDGVQSCLVSEQTNDGVYQGAHEGYSAHRADHFLTGHLSNAGNNEGIRVAMQTFTPDVVLMHLGSVDLFNGQSVSNALADINDVLDAIYETKPETLVLLANIIPWFSENPYPGIGEDIERLGDGIQRIVNERHDPFLKLVDVRSGYTASMMLNDLIHPNPDGESHIADAFINVYQSHANCTE